MTNVKKYKIVFGVHSLCAGGTERVVSTLVKHFSEYDMIEVNVLLYGRNPSFFYGIPKNVNIYTPSYNYDNNFKFISILKRIFFIRSVVKKIKPNVILNFGERWNNLVLISLLKLDFKIFVADRSNPRKKLGIIHENLRRILYKYASGVIVQTNEAGLILKDKIHSLKNVFIIPNPIFEEPINIPEIKKQEVLYVGRLIPSKNVDRLVKIFANCRVNGWILNIVGGDALGLSEKENLEKLVNDLGLIDHVKFLGSQTDVSKFYRRSSIFAFTSSSEGFPNVLAEALAYGLPCVSYNCSAGPSDLIINGKNGYLIPLYDDNKFENRLKQLMLNTNERLIMSSYASKSVLHLYPEIISRKFLNVINFDER